MRAKGKPTRHHHRVDLPRPTIEPHDVIVDKEGTAWYSILASRTWASSTRRRARSRIRVTRAQKGSPTGSLSIRFDKDENLWLGMMYQGGIAKFDRKTEQVQVWNIPAELNKPIRR
jgi:streptogramin lyase